jgi:hypothetical protein
MHWHFLKMPMGNIRGTQKVAGKWLRPLQRNLKSEELAKAKKLSKEKVVLV